jgi:hypothetical protein
LQQVFERLLGVFGHVVDLIQHNKLEPEFKQVFGFHKLVNLVADNVDSPLVGCVQMDDETLVFFYFLVLIDQVNNSGGFAGSGGSVQQDVGEILFFEHIEK